MPNEYESPIGQRPEITGAVVPPVPRHDPYAAFRSRGFRFFTTGNLLSILGRQMLAVAVEWEIYRRTHSATALGLVGLVFAIPIVGLSLPAGHLADRISRKHIILVSQIFSSVTSALLALVSWQHLAIPQMSILRACNHGFSAVANVFERHQSGFHFDDASIPIIYLLLFIGGVARTFSWAARSSFFPTLVRGTRFRTPSPGTIAFFRSDLWLARPSAVSSSPIAASRLFMSSTRSRHLRFSCSSCQFLARSNF